MLPYIRVLAALLQLCCRPVAAKVTNVLANLSVSQDVDANLRVGLSGYIHPALAADMLY